ncbi:MAG: hypothetical protein LC744_08260 [Chloroflexi bacterium]|nr:hypothetical protein [Chloroflexota bacterium]
MRRAALALLLCLSLLACRAAEGEPADGCDSTWRTREPQIVEPGGVEERTVPIDCMLPIERRRLRIGFTMPGGPDCHRLSRIDVVETADAVSVTLFVSRNDDPTAGACADAPQPVRTEIDLQQDARTRELLDGSR